MKKFLSILAVFGIAIFVFGLVTKKTNANRPVFNGGSQDELETAKQISLDILRGRAAQRAIGNVDEFQVQKVEIDDLKMAHTRVRQTVGGVPVWEGEAIVHLNQDGTLSTVTDELKEMVAVNTEPNLSAKEAVALALDGYRGRAKLTEEPTADLWVYRAPDRDRLVFRVVTPRVDGSRGTSVPVTFIDAQTGESVMNYDNLQTGSGSSLYSGTVTINTSSVGATYYMEDLTRKQGTFNMNSTGNESTGTGGTQSRYTDTDDVWNTTIQRAGVDAHYGAAKTYDYYLNVHGRNGIDGSGGPGTTTAAANSAISLVASRVHFGTSGRYNNAFWYNNMMSYGDGDGTNFTPLTTIDVCGHEMTHGVTERTANLTYSNESGALNEATSDILGSMVELYADGGTVSADTWKIGEDCYTPGTAGDALRSMSNPNSVGDPDHYSLRYTGTADNGGVHTNSSIVNHAFYLMAAGGTNRVSGVTVTGIGTSAMEKIWYKALTTYFTSGTNFSAARTATLNAASVLYGASSAQYNTVATGWCAVGVGTCPGTPTPTPTATPTVTPTPTPTPGGNLLANGGFESVITPWVMSGTGAFYTANGSAPHGGTGYAYFGVNNSVSGQTYQQVAIPTTATGTLTFWLNVTSSETTTTTQYDKLFVEVRNTSGTLLATLATYSNLNKVAAATTYSQKSFNLAAYKGQTVRIQFRTTMDSSITTTFRVDDAVLQ
ncbi:MAG: M4 family metallopeptidase [Acidobacteria bacterium]|nr:M4 family metallopeptidase [Acidobacteriota bacterium]